MAFTVFSILLLLAVAVVAMWCFVLPRFNRQVEHDEMVAALRRGDRVRTAAGLEGTVVEIGDDQARVALDGGPSVTVSSSTIRARLDSDRPA